MDFAGTVMETKPGSGVGFIVEVPRSGTTLMVNLVATRTHVAPIYETRFLRNLLLRCEQASWFSVESWLRKFFLPFGSKAFHCNFLKECSQFKRKATSYYRPSRGRGAAKRRYESFPFADSCTEYNFCELVQETNSFLQRLVSSAHDETEVYASARAYIDRLFAIHCSRMNKPFWLNKTPSLIRHLNLLPKPYPEVGIIHMGRDGRDVAVSLLSRPWGPKTLRDAAGRWKELILTGRKMAAKGNAKCLEVRYEELIRSPATTLQTVFSFLELDNNRSKSSFEQTVYTNRVSAWQSSFSEKDRKVFASEPEICSLNSSTKKTTGG